MKKEQLHINKNCDWNFAKGFSLVELLVAISIFLVFFISITSITVNFGTQAKHSSNKERAVQLAEEGLEAVRNLHDQDLLNLIDGTHGLATAGGQFNLSNTSDSTDIFTRAITISSIGSEQKKVVSEVSWSDKTSQNNSVSLSTYFTNWRAIIDTGLTISKNVINHGGSLLPGDVLPYDLETTKYDNSVDPPVLQNITIPIEFSPITMNLVPGTYDFSTTNNPDYQLTLSNDCNNGSITLQGGDAKLCVITYEEYYVPILIDPTSANITQTTATLGATVSSLGLPAVISARGVCYDTNPSPTTNCTPEGGVTLGTYTQAISSLTCGTNYYYRGYAVNSRGTGYSADGTFSTSSCASLPTLTTNTISNILTTTATGGGQITSDGGAPVTERGVVWSTSPNPTIALPTKTSNGTGIGSFVSSITNLLPNTLYYVRAYATNSAGTAYGNQVSFTTLSTTVSFVGAGSSGATTVVIPAHQVGDLLIIFAYRDGNNTAPSLPTGWTNIGTATGANNNSSRIGYRVATTASETSGTWTNATGLVVHVYRGQNNSNPIGANSDNGGNGTVITYPALTMSQSNGSSWVAGFAGHRSTNTLLETPPAGMLNRTNFVNGTNEVSGHDTNGGVSSWNAVNVNAGGSSSGWRARTLEILSR